MNTIRVLHLVSPGIGGIENYIFNHYKYMDRDRFRFNFLTQNRGLKDAKEFKDFDYEVKLLPTTAAKDRTLFVKRVREILMDGYDILHLHTCYWTGFLIEEIAKEVGIHKVIVHSHSTFIDEPDAVKREWLLQRHEEVKRAFRQDLATDFWACSWEAADWLFGPQIPRNKIKIMKNAIELERFQYDPERREQIRRALRLGDAFVFGTTGRLSYQKNQAFLVDLFELFHQKHKNSRLIIIGDGELRTDLEQQIQSKHLENDILILGWKINVEAYLQAMDCFLLPSRFEGLGIAILEAAAAGLPCVVSDQVPKDLEFTESIQRLPLQIPSWILALEKNLNRQPDRRCGVKIVQNAGYDIKRQAKVMEKLYMEV